MNNEEIIEKVAHEKDVSEISTYELAMVRGDIRKALEIKERVLYKKLSDAKIWEMIGYIEAMPDCPSLKDMAIKVEKVLNEFMQKSSEKEGNKK